MRGCVLAGIWGAGKTTIYRRTLTTLAKRCDQLIAIPQAATITTATYAPGTPEDHRDAVHASVERLADYLTGVETSWQASTLPAHRCAPRWDPTVLLECGTFDLPVYIRELGASSRSRAAAVEQRLADIGLRLVLLPVPEDKVLAQCVTSTRAHRSTRWSRYLSEFGPDDVAIATALIARQRELARWASTSPMPVTVIDTSSGDWDRYAAEITALILG